MTSLFWPFLVQLVLFYFVSHALCIFPNLQLYGLLWWKQRYCCQNVSVYFVSNYDKLLCCVYTATWNRASMIPVRLGTISGGSVNMTKACQHCAKSSCAMLAQLALTKWAGMEPAWLGTFSPASVNDIEPNPCCNCAVPSTEPVHFSPQNTWQQYQNCVAAFRVLLCLPVRLFCWQKRQ